QELVRRLLRRRRGSDDTEAVIENRLQVYLDKTVPLLEYYAGREWMFIVDGAQPPEAVHEDIVARLAKLDGFAARPLPAAELSPGEGGRPSSAARRRRRRRPRGRWRGCRERHRSGSAPRARPRTTGSAGPRWCTRS